MLDQRDASRDLNSRPLKITKQPDQQTYVELDEGMPSERSVNVTSGLSNK